MAIDWLTVSAQVVNFLVLVYLLKRFLYKPVIRAMDTREKRLLDQSLEADRRAAAADRARAQYEELERTVAAEREQRLEQAREDANAERERMVQALREEMAEKRRQWQRQVESETDSLFRQVRETIAGRVTAITRTALAQLADVELEAQMVRRFRTQLDGLSSADREALLTGARESGVRVASAFSLGDSLRGEIKAALGELLGEPVRTDFVTRAELLCGISLEAAGRRWEWAANGYLGALEHELSRMLAAPARQG